MILLPTIVLLAILVIGFIIGWACKGRLHSFQWLGATWILIMIILGFLILAFQIPFPEFSAYFKPSYFSILVKGLIAIAVFAFGEYLGDLVEEKV